MKKSTSFVWVSIAILFSIVLIILVSNCSKKNDHGLPPPFPEIEMTFHTIATNKLEMIGNTAAVHYFDQFKRDNIASYWKINNYKIEDCALIAGDVEEFSVWVTAYVESAGAGFVVGEGIPNDPRDLSQGGICPELSREFRIKSLGNGDYEIMSVGTGGGRQGLDAIDEEETSYELMRIVAGEVENTTGILHGEAANLAREIIFDYLVKSAAFPSDGIDEIKHVYLLRVTYEDGSVTEFYMYQLDERTVLQMGVDGYYSYVNQDLYWDLICLLQEE